MQIILFDSIRYVEFQYTLNLIELKQSYNLFIVHCFESLLEKSLTYFFLKRLLHQKKLVAYKEHR